MSTFRLLTRTFVSHDWHVQPFVKDRSAFRLSGAPSVRPNPLREFVRPRNLSKLSRSGDCCQPSEITGFAPVFNSGECRSKSCRSKIGFDQDWRTLFTARPKTRFHSSSPQYPAQAEAEDVQKLKIAWRLCYSRKPFRELCPRMRTPERGQLEAY